ncbi:MAG: hypothetical protein ACOCP4_04730 [Candidatus Woesearchaeota archaeon]
MKVKTNLIADQVLESGRCYPKNTVENAIIEYLKKENKFGEPHPPKNGINISPSDISHEVKDMYIDEDNTVVVDVEFLDTHIDRNLKNFDSYTAYTRGIGKVNEDNVVDDFKIISVDIVGENS